jgi:monoamine oxidase
MADKIKGKVKKGRRVTSIAFNNYKGNPGSIYVEATGETKPLRYNHVISTLPFSCLRTVDTKGMNFSWELQTAIRTLHYDNSVKVAIRFKERWWESTSEEYDYLNQRGGISTTDLPTRTVVYPSYGIGQTTGATMIVSYTWAQDAARFGALVKGHDSDEEKILVDLILSDLATMHNVQKSWLHALMEDYHAFNWYGEQNSAGG